MYYAQRNTGMGNLGLAPLVIPLIGAGLSTIPAIASLFKKEKKQGYTVAQMQQAITAAQEAESKKWQTYLLIGSGVAAAGIFAWYMLSKKEAPK